MHAVELLVVLPVFNERESIRHVFDSWLPVLEQVVGNYRILAIDDGSSDDTLEILQDIQATTAGKIEVRSRPNRGHGQTCIEGYRTALERSIPYILQIDSDGQSDPRFLQSFWKQRTRFDVIYGKRRRLDGVFRVIASFTLRGLLRLIENVNCTDANVPYRLLNSRSCEKEIRFIPGDVSLANVALAVALKRNPDLRHGEIPIDFPPRFGGEPSVALSSFVRKGFELFIQLRKLRDTTHS